MESVCGEAVAWAITVLHQGIRSNPGLPSFSFVVLLRLGGWPQSVVARPSGVLLCPSATLQRIMHVPKLLQPDSQAGKDREEVLKTLPQQHRRSSSAASARRLG